MDSPNLLTTARYRLQLSPVDDWRAVVYSPEIDGLMADMALDKDKPEVSEAAARTIGRICSEAAVKVLAEQQLKGNRQALRALALVRDEAPSLPKSVSRQARLYAWLTNTWRRLSAQPMRAVWRYVFAAVFSALAIGYYAYSQLSNSPLFATERLGKSLTTGIPVGVVFGLVVLLAAELPERLFGFWTWWSRLLLSALLGFISGVFVWVSFEWFILFLPPTSDIYLSLAVGGIFTAVAFLPTSVFRLPGWINAIWAAAAIFLSIYIPWVDYLPPLIYTRPGENISTYAIPMAVLIAIGSFLPQLTRDALRLWRWWRSRQAVPTDQPATVG